MTTWPTTTRAEVIARAKQGFGGGLGKVWYSQSSMSGAYRADCSGFVCRALGLTAADAAAHGVDWWGGMNTVTLVTSGALVEIDLDNLQAGDLCGELGPGTGGDGGHVYVFDRWLNDDPDNDQMYVYEQCGGTRGPIRSLRTWPYPDTCRAYRYAGIRDTTITVTAPPSKGVPEVYYTSVGRDRLTLKAGQVVNVQFTDGAANTGGFWGYDAKAKSGGYSVGAGGRLFTGDVTVELGTALPAGVQLATRFVETDPKKSYAVSKAHPWGPLIPAGDGRQAHVVTTSWVDPGAHLWVQLRATKDTTVTGVWAKVGLFNG